MLWKLPRQKRSESDFARTRIGCKRTFRKCTLSIAASSSASPVRSCSWPTRRRRQWRQRARLIRKTTASCCGTSRAKRWSAFMLIRGLWAQCDDGIVRPVIEGELLAADGSWLPVELLVDVGADRTVFPAGVLATLALPQLPSAQQLGGVGGAASTVTIATHLRLPLGGGASIR